MMMLHALADKALSMQHDTLQLVPAATTLTAAFGLGLQLCSPGYGDDPLLASPDFAAVCGGAGENATYGTPGRAVGTTCRPCSTEGKTVTYSFNWVRCVGTTWSGNNGCTSFDASSITFSNCT